VIALDGRSVVHQDDRHASRTGTDARATRSSTRRTPPGGNREASRQLLELLECAAGSGAPLRNLATDHGWDRRSPREGTPIADNPNLAAAGGSVRRLPSRLFPQARKGSGGGAAADGSAAGNGWRSSGSANLIHPAGDGRGSCPYGGAGHARSGADAFRSRPAFIEAMAEVPSRSCPASYSADQESCSAVSSSAI
jgi:hypothetical protein